MFKQGRKREAKGLAVLYFIIGLIILLIILAVIYFALDKLDYSDNIDPDVTMRPYVEQAQPEPFGSLLVIPYGARGGTLQDFSQGVRPYECERIVSPIREADYAMEVTGDSMSPEYPSGSRIIIKKVNSEDFIEWGKVYVLDTDNGPVIKQIRKTADPHVVECVSLNPAYQTFTVRTDLIRGWYRVLMVMALK